MVKLVGMLNQFRPVKVLVVGDFMMDTYTTGKVKRISPEAPVPVLHVQKRESRAGGAGNVVLNLVSLGAEVVAVGRIGQDAAGQEISEALKAEGVNVSGMIEQKGYQTPVKNRLIADAQQVIRVDFETATPLSDSVENQVIDALHSLISECQIVAVSDYGKGFLTPALLNAVIQTAKQKSIPVIIDPKGEEFSKYQGATVLKPNLSEAYAAAKKRPDVPLDEVAHTILHMCQVDELLITRSEAGISLFHKNGKRIDFPVRSKEVKDVTGAGDTVLATVSLALANGLDIQHGAQLANIAAGMAIERLGCARISLSELAERLLEFDVDNKVFDEEHLFALQQSLKDKKCTVLALESHQGMTHAIFKTIRKLSKKARHKLIIYVRDTSPDEEFISFLSSISEVDFIVLKCESLKNLCEILRPEAVFLMEEGEPQTLNAVSNF